MALVCFELVDITWTVGPEERRPDELDSPPVLPSLNISTPSSGETRLVAKRWSIWQPLIVNGHGIIFVLEVRREAIRACILYEWMMEFSRNISWENLLWL